MHADGCPVEDDRPRIAVFTRLDWAAGWLEATFGQEGRAWVRCGCLGPAGRSPLPADLAALLDLALEGSPQDRRLLLGDIAAYGRTAIAGVWPWFAEVDLSEFALDVVVEAGRYDGDAMRDALKVIELEAPPTVARLASERATALPPRPHGWPRVPAYLRTVRFIGDGPYRIDELVRRAPTPKRVVSGTSDGFVDTVVVGWDCDDLEAVLGLVEQQPRPPRFLPQEGWIAAVLFDRDWWLDDPATLNRMADEGHPIDQVRAAWPAEFRWPETAVQPAPSSNTGSALNAREESDLFGMGYKITGTTRDQRWRILVRTVPDLGLQPVAEHIAFLTRMRKLKDGLGHGSHAVTEWEHDLARLKVTFYRDSSRFPWPSTDP